MHIMLLYLWIVAVIAAIYLYCRQAYSRFSKYGVKNPKPLPILGNMTPIIFRTESFVDVNLNLYNKFPEERFVGNFEFLKPVVLIRDIELIKKVTVKDFEYFLDHRSFVSEDVDPFFGRNLFSLKGQEWKDMRSTLSPAFTSSKMKHMLPFIVEVGNQMVISLDQQLNESKKGYIDIETKDLATYYANDVIASCAFGLKVDSHLEPDNQFYKMGYKASNFSFVAILKFFGYASFPWLMKLLKANLFSADVTNFFQHLVLSTMKDREVHNILRPDMIHLLMEAKKGQLVHEENSGCDAGAGFATVEESNVGKKTINRAWSDIDLIAQAVLFFIAGFETVSTAMTFLLYELALNPDVQERLAEEVKEHEKKSGGKFDYNSIQNMVYMDMVVSESLRLWPPAVASDRICTKDYNLGRPNDKATQDFILKKGEGVNIPVAAIHRDPEYFPNPKKFDPERFSEENKHMIQPFTYLPFGLGPRNCIGSRFALCEVKVMVYQLVQRYELVPCERTTIPCELAKDNFNLRIKGGHWLRLKPRAFGVVVLDIVFLLLFGTHIMLVYIWIAAAIAVIYLYCRQIYSKFSKYGVKNMKPVPLFGNSSAMILRTKCFCEILDELYNKFPEERFVGFFEFLRPMTVIRDIELIKKVTVKDFEYFLDHRSFVSEEADPFFGRNLISLRGQEWKDMRSTLSPAFTSSKMKLMLPFMVEVGNQMVVSLDRQLKESKKGYIDIETKDLSTYYANDVIASCAFGLKVDSLLEPYNEFYRMGYKTSTFGFAAILKVFGHSNFPWLMKLMKMNLFPADATNFFQHLVLSTMKDREVHNIFRPDMIHLLMEAKKGQLVNEDNSVNDADAGFATAEESNVGTKNINKEWTDLDLVAQAVLFFIAGFETVSTAIAFLLYELALNPEVQEKLAQEVREHDKRSGGKFDYNSIQNMIYMDMVVSETLRLWPPAFLSDRICTKDYNLGRPNDKATQDYILKKGDGVNVPVAAIHRDPKYFPNPLKFDPERFSEENKHTIQPFTYMPFSLGPRNCIGSRFALCEVKVMVYRLVQHYVLTPCEKTTIPCELAKDSFNLRIKGGHWLRFKQRI
ncbi:uncharacterized protein LOC134791626 [Cydia splendana]|uniref:uncharacterized protein LOC134791626 n=1 Tax=Cydia splendana TaxID=1100963 RepID=UPI00300D13FD